VISAGGHDLQHSLISGADQLICITALKPSLSWITGSIPNGKCSPEDIVMPMCRSPQISDALLQASKLPANDNRPAIRIGMRTFREPKSTIKSGWLTILILCVTALLVL
jgi:hypothetical protein